MSWEKDLLLCSTSVSFQTIKAINVGPATRQSSSVTVSAGEQFNILLCPADFFCLKKCLLVEGGEDVAEKTLVHKTAVKRISTH